MGWARLGRGTLTILLLSGLTVGILAGSGRGQDTEELSEKFESVEKLALTVPEAVETVKNFFQDDRVQIAIVLVLVVLGLTLWLLGARAGRLLFALLLGTAGVIPGMYMAEALELGSLWPGAVVGGLLGMLVGVFIFKVGIMLVGMCISTLLAVGIFMLVGMASEDRAELGGAAEEWLVQVRSSDEEQFPYVTAEVEGAEVEGAEVYTAAGLDISDQAEELGSVLWRLGGKYRNGLLIAVVGGLAGGLLLQLFARPFMLVLTTSSLGTSMVLGGVCLGLAFKGKKANELLGLKPAGSMVIFAVMLGLGVLVQLTMTRKRAEEEEEEE